MNEWFIPNWTLYTMIVIGSMMIVYLLLDVLDEHYDIF